MKESERDTKFQETVKNLKRLFPGVHGRLSDLCKPTQRRYELAVTVCLGRHLDSIVVDEEKTAFDCVQVLLIDISKTFSFVMID